VSSPAVVPDQSSTSSGVPASQGTEQRGGLFYADASLDKKLAKLADVSAKIATTSSLFSAFNLSAKFLPLVTKSWTSGDGFVLAAKATDESQIKEAAWETGSALAGLAAAAIAGAGTATVANKMAIEQVLTSSASGVLLPHLDTHSGFITSIRCAFSGKPFLTPSAAKKYHQTLNSTEYNKILKDMTAGILEGHPNPTATTIQMQNLFKNAVSGKVWFPTPDFPEAGVNAALRGGIQSMPGLVSDGQKLAKVSQVGSQLSTRVLPVVSVAMDGRAALTSWQRYYAANSQEATSDALVAAATSSFSLLGSLINAAALNPRTPKRIATPAIAIGLGLMFTGAASSYLIESSVKDKTKLH
jgi:hypothetical protein